MSDLDKLSIDTLRLLAVDSIEKAANGHPGAPIALSPLAYLLYQKHMKHDPSDPMWADRDRFVLSNGHASMLQYGALFLSGYDVSLDDLKNFRQWHSKTPGHPEYAETPGIEVTTGPLGQGLPWPSVWQLQRNISARSTTSPGLRLWTTIPTASSATAV